MHTVHRKSPFTPDGMVGDMKNHEFIGATYDMERVPITADKLPETAWQIKVPLFDKKNSMWRWHNMEISAGGEVDKVISYRSEVEEAKSYPPCHRPPHSHCPLTLTLTLSLTVTPSLMEVITLVEGGLFFIRSLLHVATGKKFWRSLQA